MTVRGLYTRTELGARRQTCVVKTRDYNGYDTWQSVRSDAPCGATWGRYIAPSLGESFGAVIDTVRAELRGDDSWLYCGRGEATTAEPCEIAAETLRYTLRARDPRKRIRAGLAMPMEGRHAGCVVRYAFMPPSEQHPEGMPLTVRVGFVDPVDGRPYRIEDGARIALDSGERVLASYRGAACAPYAAPRAPSTETAVERARIAAERAERAVDEYLSELIVGLREAAVCGRTGEARVCVERSRVVYYSANPQTPAIGAGSYTTERFAFHTAEACAETLATLVHRAELARRRADMAPVGAPTPAMPTAPQPRVDALAVKREGTVRVRDAGATAGHIVERAPTAAELRANPRLPALHPAELRTALDPANVVASAVRERKDAETLRAKRLEGAAKRRAILAGRSMPAAPTTPPVTEAWRIIK